ncbi:MAG: hypothetical protein NPIRA01_32730 [Nitrospirales bacterium]|nr:MAG: hypothetical protein NPIRA01_32730 [Nitrospirales bacterium]
MKFIVGFVAVVLLFEGAIRILIGAPRPEQLPLIRVQPDPRFGYRPIPGDQHYGYDELTKLNDLGLRGEKVNPKRLDEHRILAFGGTQVYGLGIADAELFTNVLEDHLNRDDHAGTYRVINFGIRAFTLRQQLNLLEEVGVDVAPDHVMVFLDMYSMREMDIPRYYRQIEARDWYMLDLAGKPDGRVLAQWYVKQAARKSALVAWLHSLYKDWNQRSSLASKVLRGEKDAQVDRWLRFVTTQVDAFIASAKARGFTLSFILLPFPSQLSNDQPTRWYQSHLRDIVTARGLRFFDLQEPLRKLYKQTGRLPVAPFDAHYSAAAHDAIGRYLSNALYENAVVPVES